MRATTMFILPKLTAEYNIMKVTAMAARNFDNEEDEEDEECEGEDESDCDEYFFSSDDGGRESSESDNQDNDYSKSEDVEYEQNQKQLEQSMLYFQRVIMAMTLILLAEVLIVVEVPQPMQALMITMSPLVGWRGMLLD